ncbi:MAG: cysteine--tRNA ligase [Clostridiales bacterium]|nr:cysteine--tRNA ligase [Clostridiales bacterium]
MDSIYVNNTLTGTKEAFVPLHEGKVGMYCCGPTTYNYIHLGNGRPLVVFDTIRRYFLYQGYDVTYVSNFTDVDDKIIDKAASEGEDPQTLANRYIEEFYQDADALGVLRADFYPQVSKHIPEIIAFVEALVDKGMAYMMDGDVYYSVKQFPGYGKLSGRTREDMLDGARVDVDQRKEDAADFALWKKAKPGEPYWESPWGQGRPGWHIECSAMSYKYLGESFDIHGGGADLIFPHHENEIAQTEGRFGSQMVKYWMHNGFITINQEKMSKSLGNFFLVREILEQYSGQVIRFYLLSVHYRSPLDFDDGKLDMAQRGLERLKNAARTASQIIERDDEKQAREGGEPEEERERRGLVLLAEADKAKTLFDEAMNDDFNTALATAALFDLARAMNVYAGEGQPLPACMEKALGRLLTLADVLGLELLADTQDMASDEAINQALMDLLAELNSEVDIEATIDDHMAALLALRQKYREAKDYAGADKIRDGLKAIGVVVEDTQQGARWHKA